MTLVFRASSGPLTAVQIGPADVLATFAAAYTASGWLGGLDGIRDLLSRSSRFLTGSSAKQHQLLQGLFKEDFDIHNAVFYMLTSEHGPVRCEIPVSLTAFGGERLPRLIGLTICALAHEGGYDTAVTIFSDYLAPVLFEGTPELVGAVQSQLREDTTMHRLMNEGATLGLSTLFLEVSRRLGFPAGDEDWLKRNLCLDQTSSEWTFVIGLLGWLGTGMKTPYLTRSGLVARVAGYLQAVGYRISFITIWQGSPPRPCIRSPRTVVLVLGGSEETDTLMEEHSERIFFEKVMHYTYSTVGSMLHQSMFPCTTVPPEVFQTDFETIYESIRSRLQTKCYLRAKKFGGDLSIACHWAPSSSTASSIAVSLASVYFPQLSGQVAPCYERIVTNTILESVKDKEKREADALEDGLTQDIVRFRACTAAILISLIASLSHDDFCNFKHVTRLDLSDFYDLEAGCRFVNRCFESSMEFSDAVQLLATIHAARHFNLTDRDLERTDTVGWRHGIYCVLPNLLLDMRPTAESITLACHDVFYANIRVRDDGSIKSASSGNIIPNTIYLDDQMIIGAELSVFGTPQHPSLGPAQTTPPNRDLYLGLERSMHVNDPAIYFVGRIDGTVIGAISVLDVLKGVARSLSQPQECNHEISMDVFNVQTSTWIEKKRSLPVGSMETPALLAVKNDPAWALFAMGQAMYYQSCIVLRCVSCAHQVAMGHEIIRDGVVLIGYR